MVCVYVSCVNDVDCSVRSLVYIISDFCAAHSQLTMGSVLQTDWWLFECMSKVVEILGYDERE